MSIRLIDHINVATPKLEETLRFFEVLGLQIGDRPASIPVEGYWLYAGDRAVVHLQTTELDVGPSTASALNHFAFDIDDMDQMAERLRQAKVKFKIIDIDGTAIRQIFLFDPNGVRVELNYNPER
jgi:catechol 2,3-dioxygenase-like lactoylglutathione lyase family enzyme